MSPSKTRTTTSHLTSFHRPGSVTYDLSTPNSTTITLPPKSSWTSGLHWHETHTEYLRVLEGSILVTLGTTTHVHGANDGIITVPRYAPHEWKRDPSQVEGHVVVREWTDPADGMKEMFFRNLNSALLEPQSEPWGKPGRMWRELMTTLQLFVIFRDLDNWPVLLTLDEVSLGTLPLTRWFTHFCLLVAAVCGWTLGLRSQYSEYTP